MKRIVFLDNHPGLLRSLGTVFGSLLLAGIVYVILPDSMPELARRTVSIFIIAAILWATEAIPLFATSLCIVGLEILLLAEKGGLANIGGLDYVDFLKPFSSGVIILFMGGFLLSKALTKHHIDEIIAKNLLGPFTKSPLLLVYGILIITAFFSMWMSNTATAAMMLAILIPLLKRIPKADPFRLAVILAVPFGANIGGIGTPIGSPPNAIALATLRAKGLDIGFLHWMVAGVPLMVILIALSGLLLFNFYKPQNQFSLSKPGEPINKIGIQGWLVGSVLGIAIILWLTSQWTGLNEALVALLAAATLTAFRVLDQKDVDSIDWNILLLMWGGLSLSNSMNLTGLTSWVSGLPFSVIPGFLLHVVFVLVAVGLSTFMSNTATANLIIPIGIVASTQNPIYLAITIAFACSFSMALPISTPPNAMAYASGRVSAQQMFRTGGMISVIGVVLLLIGCQIILPLIFS